MIWENGTKIFLYAKILHRMNMNRIRSIVGPYTHVSRANFFVLDTFPSKTVAFERSRQVDIICTEELDVTPSSYWDIATQSSSAHMRPRKAKG